MFYYCYNMDGVIHSLVGLKIREWFRDFPREWLLCVSLLWPTHVVQCQRQKTRSSQASGDENKGGHRLTSAILQHSAKTTQQDDYRHLEIQHHQWRFLAPRVANRVHNSFLCLKISRCRFIIFHLLLFVSSTASLPDFLLVVNLL